MKNRALLFIFLLSAFSSFASEETLIAKYLCISEAARGVIYRDSWVGTSYRVGEKFLMTARNGVLMSVKDFGAPDEFSMTDCFQLEPASSHACVSNFDMFRYQPSTKRFVFAKTSGFTDEFEEAGIEFAATEFNPRIAVGFCEAI